MSHVVPYDVRGRLPRSTSYWNEAADGNDKETDTPLSGTPDTRSEVAGDEKEARRGRVAGGSYLTDEGAVPEAPEGEDYGPLKIVDVDMPLTLTTRLRQNDQDFIVLEFVDGDKENP